MKFADRYKISLHNIKNNKSRSILTTVIVYVISLLIMTILCIGISFSNNMVNVIKEYYQASNEPIHVEYNLYEPGINGKNFDKEVYDNVNSIVTNHQSIISYVKYVNNYSSQLVLGDHRFPMTYYYDIIEGNNVTSTDCATNAVLVSVEYANNYYNKTGNKLNPGEVIQYDVKYQLIDENRNYHEKIKSLSFKVSGIYKAKEMEVNNYGYNTRILSDSTDLIVDVGYLFNNINDFYLQSATYYYNVTKTNFNNSELKDKLNLFVEDLKSVTPDHSNYDTVYSNALEDLKMSEIIGIVIIGLAAFLCLVLILLSIGSLANTIMISVDKNKKFIGLLKALGLNEKDLKSTIKLESITTIVSGILLSFLTVFACRKFLASLNTLMINSIFSDYVSEINYIAIFSVPVYVPVIVLFFFVSFTLLFAKESMSKIAKTDPMAVISEVA